MSREQELLVDTGSSYVVLSGDTFAKLKRSGATAFERTIRGTTAAGRVMEAKVYSISELALSDACVLRDVEAVVLRNADRDILEFPAGVCRISLQSWETRTKRPCGSS